jgi:glutamate/tyrosine decarboxylase-like PLP-dependent enzyme
MALKFMGRQGYAHAIEKQIELTNYFAARIDELSDFERVNEIETAVCCFRFLPPEYVAAAGGEQDRLQQKLQQEIERSGEAWIHTTVINARRVLRININSFLTERRHLDDLLELLVRTGKSVAGKKP